jgi:protein-tyrosine-phosphatase
VRSAGTRCGTPGADVPKAWRACADNWTEPHAASRITPEDIAWADVVVVTQRSHEEAVRAVRADARVILRKLPDPAFRRVSDWPALAHEVAVAAEETVSEIERGAQ